MTRQVQQNIGRVLDELNSCKSGSLKGLVLEPWVLKLLSISDVKFTVSQLGVGSGGLQLAKLLSFGPMSVRDDEMKAYTFLAAVTEARSPQAEGNILLVPCVGFAVVDAIAIVGARDARHCLFLQVTVAVKHPVSGPVAADVL